MEDQSSKIFQLSGEEKEFIQSMEEKNEEITKDKIDEALSYVEKCLGTNNAGEATRCLMAAIAMSKYLQDLPRLTESAMYTGEILYYTDEYEAALQQFWGVLKFLKKRKPIFGPCKDIEAEASCYFNIGKIYNTFGTVDKAIDMLQKSLRLTDEIKAKDVAMSAHVEIGSIYLDTGYIERAITHFEKARTLSSPDQCIDTLLNLANAYADIGYADKACATLDDALQRCESYGSDEDRARIYSNKGRLFALDSQWKEAVYYYRKAFKMARKAKDRRAEALILTNLGHIYRAQGNDKALHLYKRAITLHRQYGNREGEAAVHDGLGIFLSEKDPDTALTHFQAAEKIAKDLSLYPNLQQLYKNTGLLFQPHDLGKAVALYAQSIDILEKVRALSEREEIQIQFTGEREDVFGHMVAALIQMGDVDRVFQYIERAKAYTLNRLLEEKKVFTNHHDKELATYQKVKIEYDILYSRKIRHHEWPESMHTQLTHKQELLEEFKKKIRPKYPEYVDIKPMDAQSMRKILGNSLIIEYFVFTDALCAVILGKDVNAIEPIELTPAFTRKFNRKEFIDKTLKMKVSLACDTPAYYDVLFSPLEQYLKEGQHICIIPHGLLHYIPFHALFDGNRYLIEKYKMSYSPSAAVLKFCLGREVRSHQYYVTGGGTPHMEEEAFEVATLLNVDVFEPTKKEFEKNCSNKTVIHVACHSKFLQNDPLSSYIAFQDGNLDAQHIFNLDIQADLVALSACETGLSEVAGGDELMGLTRAFLFAGAKSLMNTLWPVSGVSTKELMIIFYKNLKNGQSKLDSLRNAQLEMLHNERFKNPFYWAPFVLMGDWH